MTRLLDSLLRRTTARPARLRDADLSPAARDLLARWDPQTAS